MWFAYTDNFSSWHILKIDQVKEIIAQNKEKKRVSSLEDFAIEIVVEQEANFNNAMGQESLTRFDQPKRSKNKSKNKAPNSNPNQNPNAKQNPNSKQGQGQQQGQNQNQNPKPEVKRPVIIIKKNEDKK
jgi:hypothetical protein